jgi:geranylgeranyl pyrophosphate synthase
VFDLAATAVMQAEPSRELAVALLRRLDDARAVAEASAWFLPVDLPLVIARQVGLGTDVGAALAALAALVWTGADLLDDMADGDLGPSWRRLSSAQLTLAGCNLLATLPHTWLRSSAFASLDPEARRRLHGDLAAATFTMSAGQWDDVAPAPEWPSIERYEALVRQKTGAELGFFATLGPIAVGADEAQVRAWHRFGVEMGFVAQLATDVRDVMRDGSSDLRGGKRTEPLIFAHRALPPRVEAAGAFCREDLHDLLVGERRTEPGAVAAIRTAIEQTNSLLMSLIRVELHRKRALDAVAEAAGAVPDASPLWGLCRAFSVGQEGPG